MISSVTVRAPKNEGICGLFKPWSNTVGTGVRETRTEPNGLVIVGKNSSGTLNKGAHQAAIEVGEPKGRIKLNCFRIVFEREFVVFELEPDPASI